MWFHMEMIVLAYNIQIMNIVSEYRPIINVKLLSPMLIILYVSNTIPELCYNWYNHDKKLVGTGTYITAQHHDPNYYYVIASDNAKQISNFSDLTYINKLSIDVYKKRDGDRIQIIPKVYGILKPTTIKWHGISMDSEGFVTNIVNERCFLELLYDLYRIQKISNNDPITNSNLIKYSTYNQKIGVELNISNYTPITNGKNLNDNRIVMQSLETCGDYNLSIVTENCFAHSFVWYNTNYPDIPLFGKQIYANVSGTYHLDVLDKKYQVIYETNYQLSFDDVTEIKICKTLEYESKVALSITFYKGSEVIDCNKSEYTYTWVNQNRVVGVEPLLYPSSSGRYFAKVSKRDPINVETIMLTDEIDILLENHHLNMIIVNDMLEVIEKKSTGIYHLLANNGEIVESNDTGIFDIFDWYTKFAKSGVTQFKIEYFDNISNKKYGSSTIDVCGPLSIELNFDITTGILYASVSGGLSPENYSYEWIGTVIKLPENDRCIVEKNGYYICKVRAYDNSDHNIYQEKISDIIITCFHQNKPIVYLFDNEQLITSSEIYVDGKKHILSTLIVAANGQNNNKYKYRWIYENHELVSRSESIILDHMSKTGAYQLEIIDNNEQTIQTCIYNFQYN